MRAELSCAQSNGEELEERLDVSVGYADWVTRSLWAQRFRERAEKGVGLSLTHSPTGSRVLTGALSLSGLWMRIQSPASKSLPFASFRTIVTGTLKDEQAGGEKALLLLFRSPLGTGKDGMRSFFQTAGYFRANTAFLSGAVELILHESTRLTLEYLQSRQIEEDSTDGAWFSPSPPLPWEPATTHALALKLSGHTGGAALEAARSSSPFLGEGWYLSGGFQGEQAPWTVEAAADGTLGYYRGPDGRETGGFFRSRSRLTRTFRSREEVSIEAVASGGSFGAPLQKLDLGTSWTRPDAGEGPSLRSLSLRGKMQREEGETEERALDIDMSLGYRSWACRGGSEVTWQADIPPVCTSSLSVLYTSDTLDVRQGLSFETLRHLSLETSILFRHNAIRACLRLETKPGEGETEVSMSWSMRTFSP